MNLTRFKTLVFLIILGFIIVLVKDFYIQVLNREHYKKLVKRSLIHTVKVKGFRGLIYDSKGRTLALNYPSYDLFVDPHYFRVLNRKYKDSTYFKLKEKMFFEDVKKIAGLGEYYIMEKIKTHKNSRFLILKHNLTLSQYNQLSQSRNFIPAFGFIKDFKRYYPDGENSSHIVGFCYKDGKGAEGLENFYNRYLMAQEVKEKTTYDAFKMRKPIMPKNGNDIITSINQDIQDFLHVELERCTKEHEADFGMAIIMNPTNGRVIAMDSYPYYDNNKYWKYSYFYIKNRAVSDVFEPGSVFKLLTMSAALDSGIFKGNERIYCENGRWKLKNKIIHDVHRFKTLTFDKVFVYSSNIGSAKIALKLGKKVFYKYLFKFGLGRKTGIDTISEASGIVKDIFRVGDIDLATMAFGQGIAVTEIQLADMYSVIANGGYKIKPHFLVKIADGKKTLLRYKPESVRILKPSTVEKVRKILREVVLKGTGKRAALKDYEVAGKTGTAQIAVKGKYQKEYVASFAGFAPYSKPRFVVVVSIVNPKKGGIYGGQVAAPLFAKLMEFTLHYYGVKQDNNLYKTK